MKYSVVYSSRSGNTKLLAETLQKLLPEADCLYFGPPCEAALAAPRLFVGFWTDKGGCDEDTAAFLSTLRDKELFLFGTAGFGGEPAYFERILKAVSRRLPSGNTLLGTYMCQGKMPLSVRERYEKMLAQPIHMPNLKSMIENFDKALSHPDKTDLENFEKAVLALE